MTEIVSVSGRKFKERPHNERDALVISQQLGVPEIIGRILAGRDIMPHQAEGFLQPTLREFLPDPFHLKDMEKAARRIADEIILLLKGVEHSSSPLLTLTSSKGGFADAPPRIHATNLQRTIAIFGDYDVDGATSSALLVRYLRAFGIEPIVHIPDRIKEGYGPNTAALLSLKERGAKIVITVDCGTMAFEPLARAKEAGLDVIVADHHKGDVQMPECYALVNPNRCDETSPHTQLAACGVTFLLLVAINRVLKEGSRVEGRETSKENGLPLASCHLPPLPDLLQFLDIVALGTICDVVPLTGTNRALVTQGLKVMAKRGNPGIAACMDIARLQELPGTYHAGFIIGPRINAGGRVGKPDLGVRLLSTDDPLEAAAIARELDRFNAERKAIEALVQEEALKDATALPASDAVIVVGRTGWHPGVIGIVAGRLKEHFHKPVAVIALENGVGKASARSIQGVDLGTAVIMASQTGILLGGGGHAMAAGFTVAEDSIQALRNFFNERLTETVSVLARDKTLHFDGIVSLPGVTTQLAHLIEKAGPFGSGNHPVRLLLSNIRVVRADIVGDDHVRTILIDASGTHSSSLKAMAFRSAKTPLGQALLNARGRNVHIAGQARINTWQGNETTEFFIDDLAYAI